MRYRVEYVPNPHIVHVHTDRLILRGIERYRRGEKPKGPHADFLKALLRIRGVSEISVNNYEFSLEKGEMFSWNKILPGVVRAMRVISGKSPLIADRPTRMTIDGNGMAHTHPLVGVEVTRPR